MRHLLLIVTLLAGGAGRLPAQDVSDAATRAAASRIRPGDRIDLQFMRDRELNGSVTVTERGEAAFAKLGVLPVGDWTIAQLRDTLRARYSEYLRSPELEVNVLRRVVVNGEVRVPNVYLVDVTATVRDVIARAGGVTETGNRGRVVILRNGHRISAKGWDREGAPVIDIESGDQVIVGRKNWFVINAIPAISTAVLLASFVYTVQRN